MHANPAILDAMTIYLVNNQIYYDEAAKDGQPVNMYLCQHAACDRAITWAFGSSLRPPVNLLSSLLP
jgi:hypothetical protein